MNKIKEKIYQNKRVQELAKEIVLNQHLIADPNKYVVCNKREPNSRVFLEDKYLEGCKVLSSREKMLEELDPDAVWAEVGVATGYFSEKILEICNPKKLYMIEFDENYCKELHNKFKKEIESGVVEILQGDSVEMLKSLPDNCLDYIFLDATHDYEHPKAELEMCRYKVKGTGCIMGHDYTRLSMWECAQYGVIEAVNEFAINNSYKLKFITLDMLHSNSSYGLEKMN